MRGNVVRVVDAVLQSKAHAAELRKINATLDIAPDVIFIGSTAIQALVRHSKQLSGRIAPTGDADAVTSGEGLAEIQGKHGVKFGEVPIIEVSRTLFQREGEVHTQSQEPFKVLKALRSLADTDEIFSKLDLFTPLTGVGPVPVTSEVLENGYTVHEIDGRLARIADPWFLVATQANTQARNRGRTDRLMYLLLQTRETLGQSEADPTVAFVQMLQKALVYIGYAGQNMARAVVEHPEMKLGERSEYSRYDEGVRAFAGFVSNARNKYTRAAGTFNLSHAEGLEVVSMIADCFSVYRTDLEGANPTGRIGQA